MCVFTRSYTHSSQLLSFVFLLLFIAWNSCPHYHLLVAFATPKKEAENLDFIRLLGQSLTHDLAIIYAVAIWLVIRTIGRAKTLAYYVKGYLSSQLFTRSQFGYLLASYVAQKNDFEPISGCLGEEFANQVLASTQSLQLEALQGRVIQSDRYSTIID